MEESKPLAGEFGETLRAAAAAVGQSGVLLDVQQDGRLARADAAREARIGELRRQYLDGSYRVDPAEVAARIVDDHLG